MLTNLKKVTVRIFPHVDELTLCLAWFGCLLLVGLQLFLSGYRWICRADHLNGISRSFIPVWGHWMSSKSCGIRCKYDRKFLLPILNNTVLPVKWHQWIKVKTLLPSHDNHGDTNTSMKQCSNINQVIFSFLTTEKSYSYDLAFTL